MERHTLRRLGRHRPAPIASCGDLVEHGTSLAGLEELPPHGYWGGAQPLCDAVHRDLPSRTSLGRVDRAPGCGRHVVGHLVEALGDGPEVVWAGLAEIEE